MLARRIIFFFQRKYSGIPLPACAFERHPSIINARPPLPVVIRRLDRHRPWTSLPSIPSLLDLLPDEPKQPRRLIFRIGVVLSERNEFVEQLTLRSLEFFEGFRVALGLGCARAGEG